MRRLILSMMVSLDELIAGPDGDLGWFLTDAEFEKEMLGLLRSVDTLLFGRVSYELLAEYWPTAGTSDAGDAPGGFTTRQRKIEFAHLMNTIPKMVFSRSLTEARWTPATVVNDVRPETITGLKRQVGKDLVLFAGADLATAFMNLDLVDEYRLMVHPLVLGQGKPLFARVTEARKLKLVNARALPSGVVLLKYERARAA